MVPPEGALPGRAQVHHVARGDGAPVPRSVEDQEPPVAVDLQAELPNDCFIASVAALRALQATGTLLAQPRLLSFYKLVADGVIGHTVLTFLRRDGVVVLDPTEKLGPQIFSTALGADALALARALEGGRVTQARWVPVELPGASRGTARLAGGAAADTAASATTAMAKCACR